MVWYTIWRIDNLSVKRQRNLVLPVLSSSFRKTKIGSCINSIISDKDGNIWIGSDEGLNIITTNNDTLSYDTYNRIQCIYQDHTGTVWLGTYFDGLYSLASGSNVHKLSFKTYNSKNKLLVADEIMCIYEDKMGNLWIGTNGYGLQEV